MAAIGGRTCARTAGPAFLRPRSRRRFFQRPRGALFRAAFAGSIRVLLAAQVPARGGNPFGSWPRRELVHKPRQRIIACSGPHWPGGMRSSEQRDLAADTISPS